MTATAAAAASDVAPEVLQAFTAAVAGDLTLLADLHDYEPTAAVVAAVRACPVADQLGLRLTSETGLAALRVLADAAGELPASIDADVLDELAAAYADVYLRHTYRAAPTESVWLTEDGLERQAPMFRIRAFYRRHNMKVADAANRPDDHLVLQLRFLSRLVATASGPADLGEAARFLDEHLLRWIDLFAGRLAERAPAWFAGVALLTAAYAHELRRHLADITGVAIPKPDPKRQAPEPSQDAAPAAYVPGAAPSW
jgi:TorA maturation chaperone TorD